MSNPIGVILTDTHMSEYNIPLQRSIYQQAIEFCVDNGLKTIFHGGDVFHSRKSQPQTILIAFEEILDEIHAAGLHMISIVGNHDKTDYRSKDSFLSSFKHHPALTLIEEFKLDAVEGCVIAFISYFDEDIYLEKLQQLKDVIKEEQKQFQFNPPLLLTHIGVQGARMNSGIAIESEVKVKMFDCFKTVKIGHYHDPQSFGNIDYIGSSVQHDFGEQLNKGMQVLFDDYSTQLVPLEYPQYIKFEVDVATLTQKDLDDLRQEKENSQDNIRVILVGEEREVKAYNIQALKVSGVDVKIKVPEIQITELQTRIEPFTPQILSEQFATFCEERELDIQQGMKYFSTICAKN